MLTETGWAKVNLALHVRARRPDGYHAIESLFAFADYGDRLTGEDAEDIALAVSGPFAARLSAGEDNLVLRAARTLRDAAAPGRGARLTLDKRLPIAAGIGGGSADAAATLRLLSRLWNVDDPRLVLQIAAELGADVPACVESRTLRGEGRGDEIAIVDDSRLRGTPMLMVNPGIPVPTGPVFERWDGIDRGPLDSADPLGGRNDLEPAAISLAPAIGSLLDALRESPGLALARMSGSGATCFALFDRVEHRHRCAQRIAARWPSYWCLETALR